MYALTLKGLWAHKLRYALTGLAVVLGVAFMVGTMVLTDGHLIVLTENGDLVAVEATPKEYRESSRAHVLDALPCRAQIALASGRLYARDQQSLACWNLKR